MDSPLKLRQLSTEWSTQMPLSPLTIDTRKGYKLEKRSSANGSANLKLLNQSSSGLAQTLENVNDHLKNEVFNLKDPNDISFTWLANKWSNLGRIDSMKEFDDLLNGRIIEDQCAVLCTLNTFKDINDKFRHLYKNDERANRHYFKSVDELMSQDDKFCITELKKLIMLNTMNSCMEQNDKLLLIIYLLKTSIDQGDDEDFWVLAELLYYLSQARRFNDVFLATLDEISNFSLSCKNVNSACTSELEALFIIDTEFFEDVDPNAQIFYLGFLSNLYWKCHQEYKELFDTKSNSIIKMMLNWINWNDLYDHLKR